MTDKRVSRSALVFACLFGLVLSGCAEMKYYRPLKPAYKRSIKKMAVVSTMGNTFYAAKKGTYAFTTEAADFDFSDFGIDGKLEERAVQYMQEHSTIPALARPDLREGLDGAFDYKWNMEKALQQAGPVLKDLREQGIDALLVISRGRLPYGGGPVKPQGYGLFIKMVLYGALSTADVYLLPKFTVIDTHSEKVVIDQIDLFKEDIDIKRWYTSFSDYPQDEQQAMKDKLNKLVDEDVAKLFKQCNL